MLAHADDNSFAGLPDHYVLNDSVVVMQTGYGAALEITDTVTGEVFACRNIDKTKLSHVKALRVHQVSCLY